MYGQRDRKRKRERERERERWLTAILAVSGVIVHATIYSPVTSCSQHSQGDAWLGV